MGRPQFGAAASTDPLQWNPISPDILPANSLPLAPTRRRTGMLLVALPLVSALLGAVIGVGATLGILGSRPETVPQAVANAVSTDGASLTGVAGVAQKVIPSVVQIDTASRSRYGTRSGTGSGVIYSSDGLIITNKHVVEGASNFQVTTSDGEELPAILVGTGEGDIAVLKVDKTGLPAASLGTDGSVHVGDLAVAVGSPYGLEGTVTAGVISALNRDIDISRSETLTDLLQTDAPINPGNSGGALVNAAGQVIGINTATVDGAGSLGFAISIDAVVREVRNIVGSEA